MDITLIKAEQALSMPLDLVFLALPHGVSMKYARYFAEKNIPIIDLSGDFRLSSTSVYAQWYGQEHTFADGLAHAVYGMPELRRENIKDARLVACPGCYPTGSILALAPFVRKNVIQSGSIIIDAKSGATGAGVKASATTHFSNVNDNFRAYGLKKHRHTIEIEEKLGSINAQRSVLSEFNQPETPTSTGPIQFTPHLLPVDRGILSTIYAQPGPDNREGMSQSVLNEILTEAYADELFVRIQKSPPSLKDIRGTNLIRIYADYDERTGRIILISAIDNLVKGSSGQAIQCMNLMLGLPEDTALHSTSLYP
jgi:N-acetyl-gamma-glutamyl-phosphate reductase